MRIPTRSVVVRGITTALAFALVILVPADAGADAGADASRSETPTGAEAREQHAREVLAAVRAANRPQLRTPGTRLPYRDVTVLLQQLKLTRKDLPAAERAAAASAFEEPLGAGSYGSCSDPLLPGTATQVITSPHFCVRYTNGNTTQAQLTADTLEYVYSQEVGALGFRPPLPDGDAHLDVLLADLGSQGVYGYCATTSGEAQSASYCVLDDDFDPNQYGAPAINSLSVTAAHEFFHTIQFGYNATYSDQDAWAMEGSAVWAEDEVYPGINDYLQYVRFSSVKLPRSPIDSNAGFEVYGAVVFWKFLAEYLRDKSAVRNVWEYGDAPGGRSALQAVTAMLAARGQSFGATFARFGAWNTLPRGSYADGYLWGSPVYAANVVLRTRRARLTTRAFDLHHLSSTALVVRPGARLPKLIRLRVSVNGPSGATSPQALIQMRMRNGTVRYVPVPLNGAGDGYRIVNFNRARLASVVVTLTNASLNRADGQRFYVSARLVR